MASSDQGLVRRVTMALYIRFFSLSLKKISSISLSQKTPFLARSGEQGPVGMAHWPAEQSRRCRHEELAGHKARLNVPPQSAGARHTVHTCPLLENICSEDFSIFFAFDGALSLVIILASQVRLNPRLSKLDSKMLDV